MGAKPARKKEVQKTIFTTHVEVRLNEHELHEMDGKIAKTYIELMRANGELAGAKEKIKSLQGALTHDGKIRVAGVEQRTMGVIAELENGIVRFYREDTGIEIDRENLPRYVQYELPDDWRKFANAAANDEDAKLDSDDHDDDLADADESLSTSS